MKNKLFKLLNEIEFLKANPNPDKTLPENTFFLNDDEILCTESTYADIRVPYDMDGRNLWIYSTGRITICESRMIYLRHCLFNENSTLDFFGGIKLNENEWFPISILGVHKHMYEPVKVTRYTVYGRRDAYFIADTDEVSFMVRAAITTDKRIALSTCAVNKTDKEKEVYISAYFQPHFEYCNDIHIGSPMPRYGKLYDNGNYKFTSRMDIDYFAVLNKQFESKYAPTVESTCAKMSFMGNIRNTLSSAESLKTGHIKDVKRGINAVDVACAADIARIKLDASSDATAHYLITFLNDEKEADAQINATFDPKAISMDIEKQAEEQKKSFSNLDIKFGNMDIPKINNNIFNRFIKGVQRQVNLCALGKNYVSFFIGVRDVFQQLDTSVFWNPKATKEKIVKSLNYIFSTGRPPRQFSIPAKEDMIPAMDIREYIDQGVWIINTVYNYICVTEDYSILDEPCSYYDLVNEDAGYWKKGETTNVLDHLIRITEFLLSNVSENSDCLRIKYGDWNDAIDGLGKTEEPGQRFGDGVSVMATLQLYRNLEQMDKLLSKIGGYDELCSKYLSERERIKNGLLKNALVESSDHGTHIVHGWGDKMAYKVGTPNDFDGKCRYSATVYSFWCISEMIKNTPELHKNIMAAYDKLDSQYGVHTITPHFERDAKKYVGRIVHLTPGTYENDCAYLHSTLFSMMAMFLLGEGKRAWEQMEKVLPITHEKFSRTPFVMPNSYCYNEELGLDGESIDDWYTGSGCVLLRNIIKNIFGVQAQLDGLKIAMTNYMPTENAEISLKIKGCDVTVIYKKDGSGNRKFFVNGIEKEAVLGEVSSSPEIFIPTNELTENTIIEVIEQIKKAKSPSREENSLLGLFSLKQHKLLTIKLYNDKIIMNKFAL